MTESIDVLSKGRFALNNCDIDHDWGAHTRMLTQSFVLVLMTTLNSVRNLDLLNQLTPEKRKELSSKMADLRMAEMTSDIASEEAKERDLEPRSAKKPRAVAVDATGRLSDASILTDFPAEED